MNKKIKKKDLIFEAPKGQRLHRYFIGIHVYNDDLALWWLPKNKIWAKHGNEGRIKEN